MAGLGFICLYFRGYFGSSSLANHITAFRHPSHHIQQRPDYANLRYPRYDYYPYLFFWQTSQEIEDEIAVGQNTIKQRMGSGPEQLRRCELMYGPGTFLSNLAMFFIIAACGSVLFAHGITNINTAAQAAAALRPFAGNATYWLFAIGIIGVGLLAIPVMAGASSYAISESLGKRQGLNNKLKQAYAFYGIIIISMLIGLGLNFIGLNPIKGSDLRSYRQRIKLLPLFWY